MRILITGANGFVGKNLYWALKSHGEHELFEFDMDSDDKLLDKYCAECEFVFHLAGVNRPKEQSEFMTGNLGFTSKLLELLKKHNNTCPVVLSSSIQAELDNPYGKSKKACEELIFNYGRETGAEVFVYRFTNVFGKWCRPNYNSVIATFCHNIARDMPIVINNKNTVLNLIYIDNVVDELISNLKRKPAKKDGYCAVSPVYSKKLREIADLLYLFRESRKTLEVADFSDEFTKKLYSTYLSYLPESDIGYPLKMNIDNRGSFTEIIRTPDRGQFSVNIIKSGITKGNHWHNTKNEKFVVVAGEGVIRLRRVFEEQVFTYNVSGDEIRVIDIPPGYTHSITNTGEDDLVTFMWCNECFDPNKPDTYYLEV